MELNSGQVIAVEGVLQAFYESDQPGNGRNIIGEGGTGKTFSVMKIAQQIVPEGYKILFAAPTNKAVKQLEKAARAAGVVANNMCTFRTVHSALGLSVMPSDENKYPAQVREPILGKFDMVVVDEASMNNRVLINNYLVPALYRTERNTFLLQMGDRFQLAPVRELKSTAFEMFESFELTQNERQLDNEDGTPNTILQLAKKIRPYIENGQPLKLSLVNDQNITVYKDAQFLSAILDRFDLNTDLDEIRVLAWMNDRVDDINAAIRRKVYGPKAARFEVGERVVTGAPVKDGEDIALSTDEECLVSAMTESYINDERTGEEWKTWCLCLNPIYAESAQVFAHVLHESEQRRYDEHMRALFVQAKEAVGASRGLQWKKYWEFKELFSDIKYCYCITIHRAQGSTYTTAIVDVKNILKNPISSERKRLAYVGFSRPRCELIVNKTEFIV